MAFFFFFFGYNIIKAQTFEVRASEKGYRNNCIYRLGTYLLSVAQGRALIGEGSLIRDAALISFSLQKHMTEKKHFNEQWRKL